MSSVRQYLEFVMNKLKVMENSIEAAKFNE